MSQSVSSSLVMAVGARRVTCLPTRCTARQLARLWMTTLVVRRAPSRPPQIALMRRCALAQAPCRTDRQPVSPDIRGDQEDVDFSTGKCGLNVSRVGPPARAGSGGTRSKQIEPRQIRLQKAVSCDDANAARNSSKFVLLMKAKS